MILPTNIELMDRGLPFLLSNKISLDKKQTKKLKNTTATKVCTYSGQNRLFNVKNRTRRIWKETTAYVAL